jgi:hypothetical protein
MTLTRQYIRLGSRNVHPGRAYSTGKKKHIGSGTVVTDLKSLLYFLQSVCHEGFVYRGRIPPGVLSGRQEQFRGDIQVSQAGKISVDLHVLPSFRLFVSLPAHPLSFIGCPFCMPQRTWLVFLYRGYTRVGKISFVLRAVLYR